MKQKVAILALQGAFVEHQQMLERLGVESVQIRKLEDWTAFEASLADDVRGGIIIPGGESTTQLRLLNDLGLYGPVRQAVLAGMPVFGTCAGLIMLDGQHLGTMNIEVRRNAYGRQLGSFCTRAEVRGIGEVPMTFIRAPYITAVGDGVEVLSVLDGNIIAARQRNMLVCSFHPELNDDTSIHQMFLTEWSIFI